MLHCPRKFSVQCSAAREGDGCCEITPIDRPIAFSVHQRNPNHWDITTRWGRAFRIRGEPGGIVVHDERKNDALPPFPRNPVEFFSVAMAMAWCAEQLMDEIPKASPSYDE